MFAAAVKRVCRNPAGKYPRFSSPSLPVESFVVCDERQKIALGKMLFEVRRTGFFIALLRHVHITTKHSTETTNESLCATTTTSCFVLPLDSGPAFL